MNIEDIKVSNNVAKLIVNNELSSYYEIVRKRYFCTEKFTTVIAKIRRINDLSLFEVKYLIKNGVNIFKIEKRLVTFKSLEQKSDQKR